MHIPQFNYKNTALIDTEHLTSIQETLSSEIAQIAEAKTIKYATPYAFINIPYNKEYLDITHLVIAEKKQFNPAALIIIGIGGSHLGAAAVHQAINGLYYNERHPECPVFFIDSIDPLFVFEVQEQTKQLLQQKKKILVNIISKSGHTLETALNAQLFLDLLRTYWPDSYTEQIVLTTDEQSLLWNFGQKHGITCLPIPSLLSGRYSVFSAVGLFPLGMLNIDIEQLLLGAQAANDLALLQNAQQNIAATRASLSYIYHKQQLTLHNIFIFAAQLVQLGFWYRQLIAESLGKKGIGITPLVSVASTDLHSMIQLYMGGPRNQNTTFLTIDHLNTGTFVHHNPTVMHTDILEHLINNPRDISLAETVQAQAIGVMKAYVDEELAFGHIQFSTANPFALGWLMQTLMIETVYLGFLLNINPFDQPQVQLYKKRVIDILNQRVL